MKKISILFFAIIFSFSFSFSFGQSWLWAKEGINSNNNSFCDPNSIVTDTKGNVYETGGFHGSIVYGADTLTTTGPIDAFLIKYDSNGNVLWVNSPLVANNNSYSVAWSVAVDKNGNSYVTGYYTDTITFGAFKLGSKSTDVFLVKFAPDGRILWAKSSMELARSGNGQGYSVATDKAGSIYISGEFGDTLTFGSYTVTAKEFDVFLAKFDSLGNPLWLKSGLTSSLGNETTSCITTDSNNNVYLTGTFFDTTTYGPFRFITKSGIGSIFLVKYDSNGNVKWAKCSKAANLSYAFYYNTSNSVITDKAGDIYITGQFLDTLTFGSYTLNRFGKQDMFFVKFDTAGNIIWAKSPLLTGAGAGYSLSADKWNHIYLAGSFNDSIEFGSVKLVSSSYFPSCIFMCDTSGNAICGTSINNDNDDANAIASNPFGQNVYFGGDVESGICIFGNDTLDGGTNEYSFLAKWQPCNNIITSVNSIDEKGSVAIFPNPNNGMFTLQVKNEEQGIINIEVYNVMGEIVLTEILRSAQDDNLINLANQPNGIYLYRVINGDGGLLGSGKVVIDK